MCLLLTLAEYICKYQRIQFLLARKIEANKGDVDVDDAAARARLNKKEGKTWGPCPESNFGSARILMDRGACQFGPEPDLSSFSLSFHGEKEEEGSSEEGRIALIFSSPPEFLDPPPPFFLLLLLLLGNAPVTHEAPRSLRN